MATLDGIPMQGYAFVEYSVPNGALKCKEGMDKIEAEMRPDFRRKVVTASTFMHGLHSSCAAVSKLLFEPCPCLYLDSN